VLAGLEAEDWIRERLSGSMAVPAGVGSHRAPGERGSMPSAIPTGSPEAIER